MSETAEDSEQKKIETVIRKIKDEKCLDKAKLHEAFHSAGLQEVTDAVGSDSEDEIVYIRLYCSS